MNEDYCYRCDHGTHQCLSCSDPIPHGHVLCVDCTIQNEEEQLPTEVQR